MADYHPDRASNHSHPQAPGGYHHGQRHPAVHSHLHRAAGEDQPGGGGGGGGGGNQSQHSHSHPAQAGGYHHGERHAAVHDHAHKSVVKDEPGGGNEEPTDPDQPHTHRHPKRPGGTHHGEKHPAIHTHAHVGVQDEEPPDDDEEPPPDDDEEPPPDDEEEPPPDDDEDEEEEEEDDEEEGPPAVDADVRDALRQFLIDNELPLALMGFIEQALIEQKSFAQIVLELRQTPEYLAAYPENAMRQENGYSWMPEAQIRAYRNEARRIVADSLGFEVTNAEIAGLIGDNISLTEWEDRLRTWKDFQRWGPAVRGVLEEELGYRIPDDRLFAFFANDIPTPELDRAYEDALYRARPAVLGLGIRGEEEAALLRSYGIDVDQAFRGYQGIVAEMPRTEKLTRIEEALTGNPNLPASGSALFNDTPFAVLFRAIQLQDPTAILALRQQMAREVARFQSEGGVVQSGTAAVGLLTPEERAAG